MNPRYRMSDERWFELYGPDVGAAAVSMTDAGRLRAFNETVSMLEVRSGKVLGEPARAKCFSAFCENETGFRRLVDDAWKRGTRNACGLLIRMVESREHMDVREAA